MLHEDKRACGRDGREVFRGQLTILGLEGLWRELRECYAVAGSE